ncbi:MAG: cytochrome c biogenesis protein CcsA, partial [Actinobacteria bacterium]|nr:cytochrome c biogenesis protein CcsA [Actinomycetota bacterium]
MDAALLSTALLWAAATTAVAATVFPSRLRPGLLLQVAAILASLSAATLGWALVTVDLSLAYVAETTSRSTPWPYRLAALWGGMDGSMLFYAAMTAVVAAFAFRGRRPGLAMKVASGMTAGLLAFTAVLANPFTELAIPAVDGAGLLAILQHPAMIYHPPLLYLGLTTLVVPFALTAGRVLGSDQPGVPEVVYRWLLGSWTLLTIGMAAGSNWAYVELGWGGFWAWDPVENTALMPWLAITAFLHTSRVTRRDGRLGRSTATLAMIPFALSVLGVYLTRSGITGSIHAFAEDPVIGRILLGAALVIAVAVVALGLRAPSGPAWGAVEARRDSWLAGNSILVVAALVFVLIGSAYPAYARVFVGEEVAIDSTFYVLTVYPVALLIVTGLALALRSHWNLPGPAGGEWFGFVGLALVVGVGVVLVAGSQAWPAAPGVGIAVAAATALAIQLVRRGGKELVAHLAHLGLALVVFGAAGSALGGEF